jgi:hypothetical protein
MVYALLFTLINDVGGSKVPYGLLVHHRHSRHH